MSYLKKNTYQSSVYEVSHAIYEKKDSLINCVVEIKNLSESPLLIFKIESKGSYVDDLKDLIDYKLWITNYGHFPNNYKFKFNVLYPNEIITLSKVEKKNFQNLNEFDFLFSWIELDSISAKKAILKSIKNKEATVSKSEILKYIDSGNLVETFIKFKGNGLLKIDLN